MLWDKAMAFETGYWGEGTRSQISLTNLLESHHDIDTIIAPHFLLPLAAVVLYLALPGKHWCHMLKLFLYLPKLAHERFWLNRVTVASSFQVRKTSIVTSIWWQHKPKSLRSLYFCASAGRTVT